MGGEPMQGETAAAWSRAVELHNLYGVTEGTVYQASRAVDTDAPHPHGHRTPEPTPN